MILYSDLFCWKKDSQLLQLAVMVDYIASSYHCMTTDAYPLLSPTGHMISGVTITMW